MWSRRGILQSLLLAGAAAAMAAPLGACGFRPLYGQANTNAAGVSSNNQMASIRIDPIANRLGQQLHNALRDRFNPLGQPAATTHTLQVNLSERTYGAVARRDLSASRRNVELNAFYYLRDGAGNAVLYDRSVITTGFDEFDDPLNDISALEDAERRAALQLADQIRNRVAVFLTAGTPPYVAPAAAVAPPTTAPSAVAPVGNSGYATPNSPATPTTTTP